MGRRTITEIMFKRALNTIQSIQSLKFLSKIRVKQISCVSERIREKGLYMKLIEKKIENYIIQAVVMPPHR